jgi:hypothetical protein
VTPIPVTEVPGLTGVEGGMVYTNPAQTWRVTVPADWSPPMPDAAKPGRVVTRAPKDAVTLTVEEIAAPDDWPRLQPPAIAAFLDTAYRNEAPGLTLQSATLTAVRGPLDAGLPTYRLTYRGMTSNAPITTERFVTLPPTGAIAITAAGAPDAYAALKTTVEGIVGSLVPLRLDAPTPAALASSGAGGMPVRTLSGLALTLPTGWAAIPSPAAPPGIEYAAQSADGMQRVRVVRKMLPNGTKLTDFAATIASELKASANPYEIESERAITINGVATVSNLYRATINGIAVVGQSVALLRNGVGYAVSVDVPAAQYDAKPDDAQALFDRIESSIRLP